MKILHKFESWVEGDDVMVDADEIAAWEKQNPQPYERDELSGSSMPISMATRSNRTSS